MEEKSYYIKFSLIKIENRWKIIIDGLPSGVTIDSYINDIGLSYLFEPGIIPRLYAEKITEDGNTELQIDLTSQRLIKES